MRSGPTVVTARVARPEGKTIARSVTLLDVAQAAGVSIATASRALSGKSRVSVDTVRHVRDIAANLGYRVDPIARALREGSTRIIGMIVPVIGNPYFAQLVDAVEHEVHQSGFELLLADSHGQVAEEARRLRVFGERRVDGVLLVPSDRVASADAVRAFPEGTPIVQIDRSTGTSAADFVGIDNAVGVQLLLDHLRDRGITSIAYAGADDVTSNGLERFTAFDRQVDRDTLRVVTALRGEFSIASGARTAEQLLAGGELPDAIMAGSDLNAIGLIARLREAGVRTPEDILVTGFDGTELSQIYAPSITTVVQPVDVIAAEAMSYLLGRIAGTSSAMRSSRVAPFLRLGGSTTKSSG